MTDDLGNPVERIRPALHSGKSVHPSKKIHTQTLNSCPTPMPGNISNTTNSATFGQPAPISSQQGNPSNDDIPGELDARSTPDSYSIDQALHSRDLVEREMPADGDCLFHAVLDQLRQNDITYYRDRSGYRERMLKIPQTTAGLRQLAAREIPKLPGMSEPGQNFYTEDQVKQFVADASISNSYSKDAHQYLPAALAQVLDINLTVFRDGYSQVQNENARSKNYPELIVLNRAMENTNGEVGHYNSTAPLAAPASRPAPIQLPMHQVRPSQNPPLTPSVKRRAPLAPQTAPRIGPNVQTPVSPKITTQRTAPAAAQKSALPTPNSLRRVMTRMNASIDRILLRLSRVSQLFRS